MSDTTSMIITPTMDTRAFYDRISGVHDLLADSSEGACRDRGLSMLNVTSGERVLEVGLKVTWSRGWAPSCRSRNGQGFPSGTARVIAPEWVWRNDPTRWSWSCLKNAAR